MPVLCRFADVGVGVEAEDSDEVAEVEVANVAVADVDDGLTTARKAHHVAKSVDVADESPMSSANFLSRRRVSADLRRRNAPHMGREGEPAEAWQGAKKRKRRRGDDRRWGAGGGGARGDAGAVGSGLEDLSDSNGAQRRGCDRGDVGLDVLGDTGDTARSRGGIDKNLRKNIPSNIDLKYGSCRYVHAE